MHGGNARRRRDRLLSQGADYAEAWNFGPADADVKPVQWLVEHLAQRWGPGADWVLDDRPQPHEATYLKLDCSKAQARLGWQPRWSLSQGIDAIVEWHQAQASGADMRALSLQQIAQYEASA